MGIEDRVRIQRGIEDGESFASMARAIGVSTSTVSREVRNNRKRYVPKGKDWNLCVHKRDCERTGVCGGCGIAVCRRCARVRCWQVCDGFEELSCGTLEHAPFVCGACYRRSNCGYSQARYTAVEAQLSYEKRLVSTREGISLTPEQLETAVGLVKRRLVQGWSFEAIWAVYGDILPVSSRTMYSYAEAGVLGLANIDLPKKVRYKPRKPVGGWRPVDRDGRSHSDFLDLPRPVRARAVQMDTVMGTRRDFRNILTIHFPATEFQIMVLLDEHTVEAVVGALDWIESVVGTEVFARLFGIVLTDRGIEFCDFEAIERSALRHGRRCRVYFCDPMRSNQKGSCEKNHTMIRRVLPKGTSLEGLTPHDIATVASHVNSYPRKSLGGATPYALASRHLPRELLDELGVTAVRPDEVCLRPSLLDRTR